MNQDKLETVKQEMARLNTDILEISELKQWKMQLKLIYKQIKQFLNAT